MLPALVQVGRPIELMRRETFAPVMFVSTYSSLEDVVQLINDVPQGLAASVFSNDLRETEAFASANGPVCGIINVNVGTSGAEIGAAFGGEKETGGGREAGSDAWKGYMRRLTTTVNRSDSLPLSQGVRFSVS